MTHAAAPNTIGVVEIAAAGPSGKGGEAMLAGRPVRQVG